jgi:DNA polymerase, archaea type
LSKVEKDPSLKEEYHTHQLGAKLFANAGVGLFGSEYFEFANYQVNECITAEGRRIHRQMESLAKSYGFEVVFGFTDSTFFKIPGTNRMVHDFIHVCKDRLGAAVELKTVFVNSIFYAKKNRFVGWTGNENEEPIIKGLEGLSDLNPLWVRRWFKKIVTELVERPETRFEEITRMIREAYDEIDMGLIDLEKELKFTQRLGKDIHEYKDVGNRTRRLAELLGKDKGDMVHWYETYKDVYVDKKGKRYWKREKTYSTRPENLSLDEYKKLLLKKLKDSLEITGFDVKSLEQELAETQPLQHAYKHAPLQVQ